MRRDVTDALGVLTAYVDQCAVEITRIGDLEQKKAQLEEVRRFKERLKKKGLPISLHLKAEEQELERAVVESDKKSDIHRTYEALLEIAVRLGRACGLRLHEDLRQAIGRHDSHITSAPALRDMIVRLLEELGGAASRSAVMYRIEQKLQGRFKAADLDVLPGKKQCRWRDNLSREIRKMQDQQVLMKQNRNILKLKTSNRQIHSPPRSGAQRPQWRRASVHEDRFDLELMNPEAIHLAGYRELLNTVLAADGGNPSHFNKDASREFQRWLDAPNTPLREQAYARLSNWFLTDKEDNRSSSLAGAASNLWDALFCIKPVKRLTNPKANHKILPERFDLWWSKQMDYQKGA